MRYARIVAGRVAEVREMPPGWTPAPELLAKGLDWRPVREVVPEYDPCSQRLGGPVYAVGDAEVVATGVVVADPTAYRELRRAAYDAAGLTAAAWTIAYVQQQQDGDSRQIDQMVAIRAAIQARYPAPSEPLPEG